MNNFSQLKIKSFTAFAFLFSILFMSIFLSTYDIQEDAFITFRTAFNLSDHGELSFNVGEGHSGATSFLYPYFVALIRTITGESAIISILFINSIALLISAYIFTLICIRFFNISKDLFPFLLALIAISPITLLMAVRGMEAVYVVLLFLIGVLLINKQVENIFSFIPVILLPLIRPDAIAFSFILVGFAFSKSSSIGFRYFIASIIGFMLLITLNYFIFGNIFPATMRAKAHGVFDSTSLLKIFNNEISLYFQSPLFSPVSTKFFSPLYPVMSTIALIGSIFLISRISIFRKDQLFSALTIISGIWLVPGAFGLGGVIFPWYLWPSQFLFQGLFISCLFYICLVFFKDKFIFYGVPLIFIILLPLILIQFMLSLNTGYQEMGYRASVGKYLELQAKEGDTLFLEPAGYIPYFSKIRTIDEVGLASPLILTYKKKYRDNWWINFLKTEKPTFMVQRDHIIDYKTYQGYQLNKEEREWLNENYEIIKKFEYKPEEWSTSFIIKKILKLGSHSNYYVLRLKNSRNKLAF